MASKKSDRKSKKSDRKVLIVGASGFVGSRLMNAMADREIIPTYSHRAIPGGVRFDMGSMDLADTFLTGRHGISHAVLLQGLTSIDQCAINSHEAEVVNVRGVTRAIDQLLDGGVTPIFTSSDAVFDGSRGPWTELDKPCPILSYGRQKAAVEAHMQAISEPWSVLRLTKVISNFVDNRNILSEWLAEIAKGCVINCAFDQILSPVDIDDVVDIIISVIERSQTGLFNVAGSEIIARLGLLQKLLSYANYDIQKYAKINVCSLSDLPLAERRPKNCSLSNDNIRSALGHSFRSLDRICAEMVSSCLSGADPLWPQAISSFTEWQSALEQGSDTGDPYAPSPG